jgi:hypothetical protein
MVKTELMLRVAAVVEMMNKTVVLVEMEQLLC